MKKEKNTELSEELLERAQEGADAPPQADTPAEAADKKAKRALQQLTSMDDEDEKNVEFSLRTILGGDILTGSWFRRYFWFFVFITFLSIVYVSNRYAYQQEMIESKNLSDTLLDRRYKALTRSAELLEKTLRSHVEEDLVDSTLQTSLTPPYTLKRDAE